MLLPFRDDLANTSVALVLVLVIVGVAATGHRVAGLLAALSAAVWFDFFWTEPYQTLVISSRADVETAVLLLLVGVAITEIAAWGHRQQAAASREAGFRDGLLAAAEAVATGDSPSTVIDRVAGTTGAAARARALPVRLRHRPGPPAAGARRQRRVAAPDGGRRRRRLPPGTAHRAAGRERRAVPGPVPAHTTARSRPTRTERLVAVALADQVGAALTAYETPERP